MNSSGNQFFFNKVRRLPLSDKEKRDRVLALTEEEKKVFMSLLEGYRPKETARQLKLKCFNVRSLINSIYRKLGVETRGELIVNYRNIEV